MVDHVESSGVSWRKVPKGYLQGCTEGGLLRSGVAGLQQKFWIWLFCQKRSAVEGEISYNSCALSFFSMSVTMKKTLQTGEECVKLLRPHHFSLLQESAAPGPALSTRTPATLASRVVRQRRPCWYSNASVTLMTWILPRSKTICQALTQKIQILLWKLLCSLIGTMRSIRKMQTFVQPVNNGLLQQSFLFPPKNLTIFCSCVNNGSRPDYLTLSSWQVVMMHVRLKICKRTDWISQ